MEFSVIREMCSDEKYDNSLITDFCGALERLRLHGYYDEVYIIENFVSILFIKLLEKYTITSLYI